MTIPPIRDLDTPRLLLRVCRLEDSEAVFAAERDSIAELRRWFWWVHPEHKREHCVAWAKSRPEAWSKGEEFSFLVTDKTDGRIVGCIWLNAVDRIALRASLGYWLRTGCEGHGLATEAAQAVVRWAFQELDFQRIELVLAVENQRSRQLAERIGARFEGVARCRLRVNQLSQDARIYSLLPGEVK